MLENKSEIQCLRVVNGCNFCSIVFRFEGDEMKEKGGVGSFDFHFGEEKRKEILFSDVLFVCSNRYSTRDGSEKHTVGGAGRNVSS